MAIQYLKKSPKTSSTDDTKTREIVEGILKDIEKTKEEGCKEYSKKFDKYEGDVVVSKEKIEEIKKIKNDVSGNTDILLVPNIEAGNALVKMMIYFMGACAAGVVLGAKAPVVITSRSDEAEARLASIAASVVALN